MSSLPENSPSRSLTLKLKTMPSSSFAVPPPPAGSPPPNTPSERPKILLKRPSLPATPANIFPPTRLPAIQTNSAPPVALPGSAAPDADAAAVTPITKTQKGRVSKPSARKRAAEDVDTEEDAPSAQSQRTKPPAPKRPKLLIKKTGLNKPSRTASIVVKHSFKGELPAHKPGEGYDSEDEEREIDPIIEEQFILRMLPGEQLDYLRRMVEERKVGVPPQDGGARFSLRWLQGADRRALLTVDGVHFAAVLVDLPTITEGMKTWDRRNFMKSADVCQMLLVFARVAKDDEARTIPLPVMVSKDFRWPHGLTPPMHDCVHRRFRKRLSKKEIMDKEAELQRLLDEDKRALSTKWSFVDEAGQATTSGPNVNGHGDHDEQDIMDDEGVDDFFGGDEDAEGELDDADLEAEFMEALGEDDDAEGELVMDDTPIAVVDTPAAINDDNTGAPSEVSVEGSESEDEDLDEDEQAEADQRKGVREDINDLKKQLGSLQQQKENTANKLLRTRIEQSIKKVQSELRLKLASLGEVEDD